MRVSAERAIDVCPSVDSSGDALMLHRGRQQLRRARILSSALELAANGYEAVNIRTVAYRSEVAASTVYRYFSSKDDLLIACLHHWLVQFEVLFRTEERQDADTYRRLLRLIESITDDLCAMPRLAEAVTRAYLYADGSAATNAELVRQKLSQMFAEAIGGAQPTAHHQEVSALLTDVWSTKVLAVVQNRITVSDLLRRFEHTVAIISVHDTRRLANLGSH